MREYILILAAVVVLTALLGFTRILRPLGTNAAWALLVIGVALGILAIVGV